MTTQQQLVSLKGVSKRFGKQEVLREVELELAAGQILGLVGPSGGGKTTIINIITGLHRASAGSVEVLGEQPPLRYARRQLGYMPQSEALYQDLTATENLSFFGALYGMRKAALAEEIPRVLELARLGNTGSKVVASFSGGMKRRLSLAIALLHSPQLLVLDEPTVGLDPEHRVQLWNGFRTLAQGGSGLLITTHVMDEASHCDEIALLREGSIIARGTPKELCAQTGAAHLEEAFLAFGNARELGKSSQAFGNARELDQSSQAFGNARELDQSSQARRSAGGGSHA